MARLGAPVRRTGPGAYRIRLSARERETVGSLVEQLRELLVSEHPSSDTGVARLFPPARTDDDVIGNLEYERAHGDELLADRLRELDTMARTIERDRLDERELLEWLRSLNALRLVLGTRLDISEESRPEDFEGDERGAALYASYAYLTWLQGWVIEALDEGMRADGPGEHAP